MHVSPPFSFYPNQAHVPPLSVPQLSPLVLGLHNSSDIPSHQMSYTDFPMRTSLQHLNFPVQGYQNQTYQPAPSQLLQNPPQFPHQTQSSKISIPLSRRPDCMYFVRGSCNKGNECIFRHNILARAGTLETCANWIRYHSCDDQLCKKLHPKQILHTSFQNIDKLSLQPQQTPQPPQQTLPSLSPANTPRSLRNVVFDQTSQQQSTFVPAHSQPQSTPLLLSIAKKPDCMFFVRDVCSKGDKCTFRHNDLAKNGSLEICETWELEGKCDNPNCTSLHTRPISHSSNAAPTNSTPWSKKPDCVYFLHAGCNKKDNCLFRHNELAKLGSMEICPNWERLNQCSDAECTFVHPKSVSTDSNPIAFPPKKENVNAFNLASLSVFNGQSSTSRSPEREKDADFCLDGTEIVDDLRKSLKFRLSDDNDTSERMSYQPITCSNSNVSLKLDHVLEIVSDEPIEQQLLDNIFGSLIKSKNVKIEILTNYRACAIFATAELAKQKQADFGDSALMSKQFHGVQIIPFPLASQKVQKRALTSEWGIVLTAPNVVIKEKHYKTKKLNKNSDHNELESLTVSLETLDHAVIRYTLDATLPNTSSTLYSGPITIPIGTTLIAQCSKQFRQQSNCTTFVVSDVLSALISNISDYTFNTSNSVFLPYGKLCDCQKTKADNNSSMGQKTLVIHNGLISRKEEFEDDINNIMTLRSSCLLTPVSVMINPYCIIDQRNEGRSLFDYIHQKEGAKLEITQRLHILRCISEGVQFLHSNDFPHGKLSLYSVILFTNNIVKLCDYGLDSVQTEVSFQNVHFLSPERLQSHTLVGLYASKGDDMYAIGTIAYQMGISACEFINPLKEKKQTKKTYSLAAFPHTLQNTLAKSHLHLTRERQNEDVVNLNSKADSRIRHSLNLVTFLGKDQSHNHSFQQNDQSLINSTPNEQKLGSLSRSNSSSDSSQNESDDDSHPQQNLRKNPSQNSLSSYGKLSSEEKMKLNELVDYFKAGRRLEIPPLCEFSYGKLITKCWKHNPEKRPDFCKLLQKIDSLTTVSLKR